MPSSPPLVQNEPTCPLFFKERVSRAHCIFFLPPTLNGESNFLNRNSPCLNNLRFISFTCPLSLRTHPPSPSPCFQEPRKILAELPYLSKAALTLPLVHTGAPFLRLGRKTVFSPPTSPLLPLEIPPSISDPFLTGSRNSVA